LEPGDGLGNLKTALPFRRPLRNYDITELHNVGFQRIG
jgi:hypothetical protein